MQKIYSRSIALIGGGPASLMLLKHIADGNLQPSIVMIFEKNDRLGVGMPYGTRGSNKEHVANVSATELPKFDVSFKDYINNHPTKEFPDFFSDGQFNEDKVIPRLFCLEIT
ncbi:FAD/NAD(P)-binding protein [Epilithonimonas sp.]|uniref:FAD/NAD(P)-binding protein n=1 Tax=Epilithonimonas sp. TaxID=2894511 RepID=UPI00289A8094|nr:FAD/NAD(P)-binding protein [Epilithonimonas sp.]